MSSLFVQNKNTYRSVTFSTTWSTQSYHRLSFSATHAFKVLQFNVDLHSHNPADG